MLGTRSILLFCFRHHHQEVQTTLQRCSSHLYLIAMTSAAECQLDDNSDIQVAEAVAKWDGSGCLVFTSSTGMYSAESGTCDENSDVFPADHSERIARLWGAEKAVLEAGGCVVRLAGLYHADRGAHPFFFRKGEVARRGESIINLIHYEDGASIAVAVRHLFCVGRRCNVAF